MEEAASSSRAKEPPTDDNVITQAMNAAFFRQLIFSDSSNPLEVRNSLFADPSSVSDDVSSEPIASEASVSDYPDRQKLANTVSENISHHTTSDNLSGSSSNDVPIEYSTREFVHGINNHVSSSHAISNKKPSDDIWTSDSEYGVSLRKLRDAFNRAADTVVDIVNNTICRKCPPSFVSHIMYRKCQPPVYEGVFNELMRPLPPLVVPVLKDAAFLRAAQKGEGHALIHLLRLGAQGDAADIEKRNALHLACIGGWRECVYYLVDYRAISYFREKGYVRETYRKWEPKTDFEAVDLYSKTPLDYAKEKGNWEYLIEDPIEWNHKRKVLRKKKS